MTHYTFLIDISRMTLPRLFIVFPSKTPKCICFYFYHSRLPSNSAQVTHPSPQHFLWHFLRHSSEISSPRWTCSVLIHHNISLKAPINCRLWQVTDSQSTSVTSSACPSSINLRSTGTSTQITALMGHQIGRDLFALKLHLFGMRRCEPSVHKTSPRGHTPWVRVVRAAGEWNSVKGHLIIKGPSWETLHSTICLSDG